MTPRRRLASLVAAIAVVTGCAPGPTEPSTGAVTPAATTVATPGPSPRIVHSSEVLLDTVGEPIDIADLSGRIVTDDFEDVFAFDPDGSNVVAIASAPGMEFDGAWSPDGQWVVYRDSTRGINEDDEIYVVRADGSERRNITNNPANDWGPDWSPDGSTIVFNSDREGGLRGYLMNPDGTNVRRIPIDAWFEYPSFSPDGARIAFEGAVGGTYDVYVTDVATWAVTRLTDAPGNDSWPAWSPDGATIAFSSQRDDCQIAPPVQECWRGEGPSDIHHDVWRIDPDGTDLRRVTPEIGQFVAWSPDGEYLLVSGHALFVIRPDGTGRLELRADGIPHALGGIPDWR